MIGKAPAASVAVPALRGATAPLYSLGLPSSPSRSLHPCASWGLALEFAASWLHGSLSRHVRPPLCRLGRTCWMHVLGFKCCWDSHQTRGAAEKEWKREQGMDTPSLPMPRVSHPAL